MALALDYTATKTMSYYVRYHGCSFGTVQFTERHPADRNPERAVHHGRCAQAVAMVPTAENRLRRDISEAFQKIHLKVLAC